MRLGARRDAHPERGRVVLGRVRVQRLRDVRRERSLEMVSVYDPPTIAAGATETSYAYNLDRQPSTVTQPGPRLISYDYDTAGRLTTTTFPTGVISSTFDGSGRVATISGPTGVGLTFGYDGSLMQSVAWSGAVTGTLSRTFDSDFRLASERVNGGPPVAFT